MNEDCKRKEAAGSSSDQKKYDFNISKLACLLEFKMRMKEIAITITLQNEIGISKGQLNSECLFGAFKST